MTDSNTEKIIQAVVNGLTTLRIEMQKGFKETEDSLGKKIDRVEERLTQRINKAGKQLAYLEDDAPTREEFDKLEKKVDRHILKSSHSHSVN